MGLLNRKQRAGLRAPEPWECAWTCVSTVDERTMRCAACPYTVTAGRVAPGAAPRHDSNSASCAMQPCSRACDGGFTEWSPCSTPCGAGAQSRRFEVAPAHCSTSPRHRMSFSFRNKGCQCVG